MHNLAELFEWLARSPQAFFSPITYLTAKSYLTGLKMGLRFSGIEWSWEYYNAAAEARGWDPRGSIGIVRDFEDKGLSDAEMVRELIAVEADAYMRMLARTKKQV